MTDITKLPARLRADAKEEVDIDEHNRLWSSGVNYAAHQLANALPTWTKITDSEDTWPPTDTEIMLADWIDGWQIANFFNEFHIKDDEGCYWRPLCDLDYPPEDK